MTCSSFLIGVETGGVKGFSVSFISVFFGSSYFFSYVFWTSVTFGVSGLTEAAGTRMDFVTETFSNGASIFLDSTLT